MHDARQAQHRLDQRLPWRAREPGFGVEDFSRRVSWRLRPSVTLCALSRGLRPADPARAFGAGRLVVLHLRQQMIARLDHARERFF